MHPVLPESSLHVVAELDIPPGNLAVSSKNRIFFNFHPEYNPNPIKIAELTSKSTFKPFPSLNFQNDIVTCLSMRIDSRDRLWLLDFAQHGIGGNPKILGFQLSDGEESDIPVVKHTFPTHVAGFGSMLNDFQIDPTGETIYIVDTSIVGQNPGIIIFSIQDNRSYRVLSSDSRLFGRSFFLNVSGFSLRFGPLGFKIHVDSVALDRDGDILYFGPVTGENLYAASTRELRSNNFTEVGVSLVAEDKPASDGMSSDAAGNLWITCIESSSLALALPGPSPRKIIKVIESRKYLRWPDGLSFGPDGLYITNSALHLHMEALFSGRPSPPVDKRPYHIMLLPTQALRQLASELGQDFQMPTSGQ